MDPIPSDAFLSGYPPAIVRQANRLRVLVKAAAPQASERVRAGWRLIGYDLPHGRGTRFFAYVAPEPIHVHLGFEFGAWMRDPDGLLQGAHLRLVKVRYLTFLPDEEIDRSTVLAQVREAALVAHMTPADRMARLLDRAWQPG